MGTLFTSTLFIILVVVLFVLVVYGYAVTMKKAGVSSALAKKRVIKVTLLLLTLLSLYALAAQTGFFRAFEAVPPRLPLILVISTAAITYIVTRKETGRLLRFMPPQWLLYIQSFRILMEVILWMLASEGVIHHRLTFEGANFDVLSGVILPIIAYLVFKKGILSKGWAIAANVLGLALVTIIVAMAVLSTPLFDFFGDKPLNEVVFYNPFIWLPGFVVPVAVLCHVLSLKQLLKKE